MLFWIIAVAMLLFAMGLVIAPLWRNSRPGPQQGPQQSSDAVNVALYRQRHAELEQEFTAGQLNEQAYRQALTELEHQLLLDTAPSPQNKDIGMQENLEPRPRARYWIIAIVAVALPVVAISLYLEIGGDSNNQNPASQQPPASVQAMVSGLEDRLKDTPDDGEGWLMLGRSYSVMGRPEEAVSALSQARRILGDTPPVLLEYAQALASVRQPPSFSGRPAELIQQALEKAPSDPQALWLSGVAAAERADYSGAEKHWQKLLALQPPGSEDARIIQQNLEAVRTEIDGEMANSENIKSGASDTAPASLLVTVNLAPELANNASPQDPVFIFARAAQGSPMPLAVARHQVSELPLTITLDSGDAMAPGGGINNQQQVEVIARVSKSGGVRAKAGDLQTAPQSIVVNGETQILLVIDTIVK